MSNKLYEETSIQNIANAIRTKNGSTNTYNVGSMAEAIQNLPDAIYTSEDFIFTYSVLSETDKIISINGFSLFGINDSKLDKVNLKIEQSYIINGIEYTVTKIGDSAFTGRPSTVTGGSVFSDINGKIETVTLPTTVTSIGSNAFSGYTENTALKAVTGTENVTFIGDYAFEKTVLLETLSFPAITSLGVGAFLWGGIKNIAFGAGLTAIPEKCFHFCDMLETVSGTENVSTIGAHAFSMCYVLKSMPMTVGTVTDIGDYAFSSCGLEFDFSTLTDCTFGTYATRAQTYPNMTESGLTQCDLSDTLAIGRGKRITHTNYFPTNPFSSYGVTFTYNDFTFTIEGTATGDRSIPLFGKKDDKFTLSAGRYFLGGMPKGYGKDIACLGIRDDEGTFAADFGDGTTFEITKDTNVYLIFAFYTGAVFPTGTTITPILCKCEKALSYSHHANAWGNRHKSLTCTWYSLAAAYDKFNAVEYTPLELSALVAIDNPAWVEDTVEFGRTYENIYVSERVFINGQTELSTIYDTLASGNLIRLSYYMKPYDQDTDYGQNNEFGYIGHSILIYGVDENGRLLVSDDSPRKAAVLKNIIFGRTYKIMPYNLFSKILKADGTTTSSAYSITSKITE